MVQNCRPFNMSSVLILTDVCFSEELFTPEQSLTQKVFSLALLLVFLIIIIIEVIIVHLSFKDVMILSTCSYFERNVK